MPAGASLAWVRRRAITGTRRVTRGAILDVDGTLVDSNDAHAAAYVSAFADEHIRVPFERVRSLIGMGFGEAPRGRRRGNRLRDDETSLRSRRKSTLRTNTSRACARAGARAILLDAMRRRGIKRVIATSAPSDEIGHLLRAGRIEDSHRGRDDLERREGFEARS